MEIKQDLVNGTVEFVTYIGGDAYSAPVMLKSDGTLQNYLFLHRDYLGSIVAVTTQSGNVEEKRLFDAWGNITKVQDGAGNILLELSVTDRGYTGHEHLQGVNLIHMNGRLYDPVVHRFLQPDNYIQDPHNTQNYNRYAYVLNNPLKYTDPSGEEIISFTAAVIIGAVIAATTYSIKASYTYGFQASGWGLFKATFIGAVSASVTHGIGSYASTITNFTDKIVFQAFAHGTSQAFFTGIQGGNPMVGFASGTLSSITSSVWSGGGQGQWQGVGGNFADKGVGIIAFGTVSGGAGAALTGGNFWEGAATGLVVSGLNHAAHSMNSQKNGHNLTKDEIKKIYENYPHPVGDSKVSLDELMSLIGGPLETEYNTQGSLYKELNNNTCALRLSYAMNKSGFSVNGDYQGAKGMKYFTSATRMTNNYLTKFNWRYVYDNPKNITSIGLVAQYRSNGTVMHVDVIYNNKVGTAIYTQNVFENVNWYPGN
jgi:RHS repeat-associated protein